MSRIHTVVWEHQPSRSRQRRRCGAGRSGLSKWEVGPIGAAAAEVVQSKEKKLTGCSGSGEATDQNRKVRWEVTEFGGVMFWIMFNRQLEFNIGELKGRLA